MKKFKVIEEGRWLDMDEMGKLRGGVCNGLQIFRNCNDQDYVTCSGGFDIVSCRLKITCGRNQACQIDGSAKTPGCAPNNVIVPIG